MTAKARVHTVAKPATGAKPASIEGALAAAARFGLAGCRPHGLLAPEAIEGRTDLIRGELPACRPAEGQLVAAAGQRGGELRELGGAKLVSLIDYQPRVPGVHALILGAGRPGPHCVLATPAGWWSWGQLYSPWPCAIEEAWEVSWDGR